MAFALSPASFKGDLSDMSLESLIQLKEFFNIASLYDVDVSSMPFSVVKVYREIERRKNEKE